MQIKGQSALVTGGGSGLGEATARALAAALRAVCPADWDAEAARHWWATHPESFATESMAAESMAPEPTRA